MEHFVDAMNSLQVFLEGFSDRAPLGLRSRIYLNDFVFLKSIWIYLMLITPESRRVRNVILSPKLTSKVGLRTPRTPFDPNWAGVEAWEPCHSRIETEMS